MYGSFYWSKFITLLTGKLEKRQKSSSTLIDINQEVRIEFAACQKLSGSVLNVISEPEKIMLST